MFLVLESFTHGASSVRFCLTSVFPDVVLCCVSGGHPVSTGSTMGDWDTAAVPVFPRGFYGIFSKYNIFIFHFAVCYFLISNFIMSLYVEGHLIIWKNVWWETVSESTGLSNAAICPHVSTVQVIPRIWSYRQVFKKSPAILSTAELQFYFMPSVAHLGCFGSHVGQSQCRWCKHSSPPSQNGVR